MKLEELKKLLEKHVDLYNKQRVQMNCASISSREEAVLYDFINSFIQHEENFNEKISKITK